MKHGKKLLALLLLAAIALASCSASVARSAASHTEVSETDASVKADELLKERLAENGTTGYEITEEVKGFFSDDPALFLAGYQWKAGEEEGTYGFKMKYQADGSYEMIDEGPTAGYTILKH